MSDQVDRLGRSVAFISAMIAATVSVASLTSSCAKERSERYSAFRGAVATEDAQWRALYDDYLSTFSADFASNPERKRAKILALFVIAQRRLPSFREFDVDESEKKEAVVRLTAMQTGLLNSLEQQGAADPSLARRIATLSYAGKLRIETAGAAAQPSSTGGQSSTREEVRREIVALTSESATGWDVDLFWCDGQSAEANYRTAMAVGESLAVAARIGRSIAPGVTLGRIRVRPTPPALQNGDGPGRRTWVVADKSEGERDAAIAIQRAVNNALRGPVFGLGSSEGTPTRWYVSAFVCPESGARSPNAEATGRDGDASASPITATAN